MKVTHRRRWLCGWAALLPILCFNSFLHAAWFDSAWAYRRPIHIMWDAEHASEDGLASAVLYTDGHALPNGEDVRVATEEGKLVASHVLMVGPGDRIRVVWQMPKGVHDYAIYFGNPKPAPPPQGMDDVHYTSGLLMETRQWTGGAISNYQQFERSWQRSKPELGKIMIDRLFIGYNPFGPQDQWISKFTGSILIPTDGIFSFAMAADDVGDLYIDGKPLIFAPLGPGDTRHHAEIHLTRGRHQVLAHHVNFAGNSYLSLGWRRPDMARYEIVPRESFGICFSGMVGPMQQHNKALVADFSVEQQSECFFDDVYCFRYHFASNAKVAIATKVRWDFGDGQTSDQPEVDHVYLADGVYPVKLTANADGNVDTQTCQVAVSRNYAHILEAKEEPPKLLADIVQTEDTNKLPADQWVRLMQLYASANRLDLAVPVARKIAAERRHSDTGVVLSAMMKLTKQLVDADKPSDAVSIWEKAPADSDLQPAAAKEGARLASWWMGDFGKAAQLLKPFENRGDIGLRRLYAQDSILSGNAEAGRKILAAMASDLPAARRAALSGADARTVEFFITEKDPESGEEAWERWQARFPTDFEEGYSVVLRTKLMELRNCPQAAAKLAEAFANAQPQSPYAPQLLDRASKLLVSADPPKSQALRQLLKQKYPEDPLSQN